MSDPIHFKEDTHPAGVRALSKPSRPATVYSLDDRYRGVYGTRRVMLMHEADIQALGFFDGSVVTPTTDVDDGVVREVTGLRVMRYDVPRGCVAGYFPECNPLIPLAHHAEERQAPAAKSIPIGLRLSEFISAETSVSRLPNP